MTDTKNKKQVKQHKVEEDYKDKYLRALADYNNLEKRILSEKDAVSHAAKKNVILRLLPYLDNLEKAEVFVKDPGLKLVRDQFYQTLLQEGLEEITDLVGAPFDPETAEAVEVVAGEADNIVTEVIRRGFKLGRGILRPAQVKVSKKL